MLALKIPADEPSSFKQYLQKMQVGEKLYATSLDGDFVLPRDISQQELVFIAGGIGITPFRSMIRYLIDNKEQAKITLFHCNNSAEDILWEELWEEGAQAFALRKVDVLSNPSRDWQGERGFIDQDMLKRQLEGELGEKRYYLSGPPAMVDNYSRLLRGLGVAGKNIITDYFPGTS